MTEKKTDKKDVSAAVDDEHQKRWYVVNTYSGHENRVKDNLEKRVESMGIQDSLFRIVVAEEPEIEIKNGKQVEKMHNMFPGYVFVEMKMTDEAWYVVRNTPGVTGFIGSSGGGAKPFPVAPDEMESILRRMGKSDKKVDVNFGIGDRVRILTGPFSGMEGKVSSMNDQTQVANVLTMLFGRETPTDINYTDLEKIND
ncbi:transcription termination/antitermination protein NusG [Lactimicrobium massiliense]|uniref:transcription termination/antitermination protein NusG n=1 Tax=Lactimicrobium massiliense TaxID=2161814 RepID=UPI000D55DF17|nr:transcription termination/antitermination protein NusG [Lactimicrobium massiliense]